MSERPVQMRPLVVDLDGTFIRSDLLMECFWRGMGVAPVRTVLTSVRLITRRAALKQALAEIAAPDIERLPLDPDVGKAIDAARAESRPVWLVSGSTDVLVQRVAREHGPFAFAAGSDSERNLTSTRKADYLREQTAELDGYDYIGDSAADIAVWHEARTCYAAGAEPGFLKKLSARGIAAEPVGGPWKRRALLQAMRPHQWLKNLLLLLPLVAAHRFDAAALIPVLLGIVAFSALASSIYIVNDLTDLDADRQHEKKQFRPFASGAVPIRTGMLASLLLGLFGLALGAMIGFWMFVVLVIYLVCTLSYSMHLKRVRWVDVAMLAALYTLRVVAGAVAAGVVASGWLFGFIFPVFLSLGCVKRLTELSRATTTGFLPGRRYRVEDRDDLLNVGILAAHGAVAVFVAYSFSETAAVLYDSQVTLWAVAALVALWLTRMLYTGWTGQQDYDPIIFAITDKIGVSLVALSIALLALVAV
ncbi:UbiA family prenyltransferase [Oceanibium sediminis]|uniref:UbiA family prenyltransferase n=1 Tax=Oceanibium sediminis TaxID=2026339 RepID=UPI000DD343B4|nr:UbiA family prenyltransferase [Oceanibium sediminis]